MASFGTVPKIFRHLNRGNIPDVPGYRREGAWEEGEHRRRLHGAVEELGGRVLLDREPVIVDSSNVTNSAFTVGDEGVYGIDDDDIGGAATVTLVPLARARKYVKKLGSTASITVKSAGGEPIDGSPTVVLSTKNDAALFLYVESLSEWWVL